MYVHRVYSDKPMIFDMACRISEVGNPGVAPRNVANQTLFTNAAASAAAGSDPAILYYPGAPPSSGSDGGTMTRNEIDASKLTGAKSLTRLYGAFGYSV